MAYLKVGSKNWKDYQCSDYFDSPFAEHGWWDEETQFWYIEPARNLRESVNRDFLVIGGPGVDGIEWGYRKGHVGIWAHYPVDHEFVLIAPSASELRDGYLSGSIKV